MSLPHINVDVIFALHTSVITALAVLWGINKAIIIAKSH